MKLTLDLDAIDYAKVARCAEYAGVSEPHMLGCIVRLLKDFLPEADEVGVVHGVRPAFAEMRMAQTEYYKPVIPALERFGVVGISRRGFIQFLGVQTDDSERQGRRFVRA